MKALMFFLVLLVLSGCNMNPPVNAAHWKACEIACSQSNGVKFAQPVSQGTRCVCNEDKFNTDPIIGKENTGEK